MRKPNSKIRELNKTGAVTHKLMCLRNEYTNFA